jgi:hypothetical protein
MRLRTLSAALVLALAVSQTGCSLCHRGSCSTCASPGVVSTVPAPPAPCGCANPGAPAPGVVAPPGQVYSVPAAPVPIVPH